MNGSSCPTCGWVLRWLPEQNAWGCDRCRKVIPPGQVATPQGAPAGFAPPGPPPGAPPSPYAPQGGGAAPAFAPHGHAPHAPHGHAPHGHAPHGAYATPPHGGGSSKGLIIGLGAVAVAGAVVAIVLVTRGGGGGGGHGSREDLVKSTIAAIGAGDVEKLVKLSDPIGLHNLAIDCTERDKQEKDKDANKDGDGDGDGDKDADVDDSDDPQIQEKRLRRRHEKLVEKTKGMKIELVSIAGDQDKDKSKAKDGAKDDDNAKDKSDGIEMKKGDKAMKGCVFKVDVAIHTVLAKVKITGPDDKEASEREAKLMAIEAGGSWYLAEPPQLKAGDGSVAERDLGGGGGGSKIAGGDGDGDGDAGDAEVKQALAKLEAFKNLMCQCKDAECAKRVQEDMKTWASSLPKTKNTNAREEDTTRATEIMQQFVECATKAAGGDSMPKPPDEPKLPDEPKPDDSSDATGAASADLASLPACGEYKRLLDETRSCRKFPPSSLRTLRKGWTQLEQAWATGRSNAGTREQMTQACEQLVTAVKKSVSQMCP